MDAAPPLEMFTEHIPARGAERRSLDGPPPLRCDEKLVLPFEQRQKARQRTKLCSGRDVGIQLARGTVLRGGDRLRSERGTLIEVVAASEAVSTVRSRNLRELARAAYHLGNRHVTLEVGFGWVRYLTDHVLDAMLEHMGLTVCHENEAFEPEAGAYHGTHSHAHDHDHDHEQGHDHGHPDAGHGHLADVVSLPGRHRRDQ